MLEKKPLVSRHRIIQMLKHLKRKSDKGIPIVLVYSYQNSIGGNWERTYRGYIRDFKVETISCNDGKPYEYKITLNYLSNKTGDICKMEEYLPRYAYFTGLCEIEWIYSGPTCYFYGEWGK